MAIRKLVSQVSCMRIGGEPRLGPAARVIAKHQRFQMLRVLEAVREALIAAAMLAIAITLLRLALTLAP